MVGSPNSDTFSESENARLDIYCCFNTRQSVAKLAFEPKLWPVSSIKTTVRSETTSSTKLLEYTVTQSELGLHKQGSIAKHGNIDPDYFDQ